VKKEPRSRLWLRRSTLSYVERYPASVRRVQQVMRRRIERRLRGRCEGRDPVDEVGLEVAAERQQLLAELDLLLVSLQQHGHLDDQRQAGLWVDAWHRKGHSVRVIRQRLLERGIAAELADLVVAEFQDRGEGDSVDLAAADNYARRRRLGPYRRDPERRAEFRRRDLAALARRGFSYGVASSVIDRP